MLPSHQCKRAVCSETHQCPDCCSQRQESKCERLAHGQHMCHGAWPAHMLMVRLELLENFWKNRGVSPCASWLESFSAHSRSPGSMLFESLLLMVAAENAGWVGPSMHRKLRLLEIVHFLVEAGRSTVPMGERGQGPWFESFLLIQNANFSFLITTGENFVKSALLATIFWKKIMTAINCENCWFLGSLNVYCSQCRVSLVCSLSVYVCGWW